MGLEAQRSSIERYAAQIDETIAGVFVETESGSKKNRPELIRALAACKRCKATLIIAKLDRLARNVAFVSSLMEAGIEFIAVDAPYANKLMLHILSAFAEHEREMISERTKAALAAAKVRGIELGKNGKVLAAHNQNAANAFALTVEPNIRQAMSNGSCTYQAISNFLTTSNVKTSDGGQWHPTTVMRMMKRLNLRFGDQTSGTIKS